MLTFNSIINIVLCLIVSIPMLYILMFTHEVGHALIASIGGLKPRIYIHRKSIIENSEISTRENYNKILDYIYPRGCCALLEEDISGRSIYFWIFFYLSGVLSQFILTMIVIVLSKMIFGGVIELAKIFISLSLIMAFDAIYPRQYKDGYDSDGKKIINLINQYYRKK